MDYSNALKALAEPQRLKILKLIAEKEEINALGILEYLSISQPTLSHHMKILTESQLVSVREEGLWCHYSINKHKLKEIANAILDITQISKTKQKKELDESLL